MEHKNFPWSFTSVGGAKTAFTASKTSSTGFAASICGKRNSHLLLKHTALLNHLKQFLPGREKGGGKQE